MSEQNHVACDLLIKNALVFDGSVVREGLNSVGIVDNKISFLGRSDDSAAREIDALGRFLMPGLIDCHIHLLWTAKDETTMAVDIETELPKRLNDFLAAGVTTVKSVGNSRGRHPARAARLASGGTHRSPSAGNRTIVLRSGQSSATTICAQNPWLRYRTTVETDSPEQAREAVRRLAGKKVHAVRQIVYQGGWRHGIQYFFKAEALGLNVQIRRVEREVLEAIIDEAHKHGLKVTLHTVDQEAAIEALETGADGLEHGIMDFTY